MENTREESCEIKENSAEPKKPLFQQPISPMQENRTVAENAAELLGEILYETPPEDPYTKEDLRNNNFSTRTTIEQPEIRTIQPTNSDSVENMSWYDTIP